MVRLSHYVVCEDSDVHDDNQNPRCPLHRSGTFYIYSSIDFPHARTDARVLLVCRSAKWRLAVLLG